ncbi:site-specific integrase [Duganella vulcania]|uniref:Tyrosine-type recombinase/integrase n=1 Tax=Duganella vulcania TaxID=2692166 RepID=A0A845GTV4_9BURK|nr:site-specific integrase [Duganella vulcania]MYM96097.1 tyrosine-type recombinase/integrase [Duganella vulcania]
MLEAKKEIEENTSEGSVEGIQLRQGKTKQSIRIIFRFQGKLCRETLEWDHTPKNIKKAKRMRAAILHDISNQEFYYEKYFPDSVTAREIVRQREAELAKEIAARSIFDKTIGLYLDEYFRLGSLRWKNSSRNEYEQVISQLKKIFGSEKPIKDFNVKFIRNWIIELDVGRSRANNLTAPLKGALQLAAIDEVIEYNPFDLLKIRDLQQRSDDDDEDGKDIDPFSVDEIAAILKACRPEERNMIQFAFGTGLRICEYIHAKWAWYSPKEERIAISGNYVDGVEQKKGKTSKSNRSVDLRFMAYDALQNQRSYSSDDLIFLDARYNTRWTGDKAIRQRWGRILKAAGVRYRNPYQTRHTFASNLLMLGANTLYVATQLGHENTAMVERHYSRWITGGLDGNRRTQLLALYSQIDPKRRNEFPVFELSD